MRQFIGRLRLISYCCSYAVAVKFKYNTFISVVCFPRSTSYIYPQISSTSTQQKF